MIECSSSDMGVQSSLFTKSKRERGRVRERDSERERERERFCCDKPISEFIHMHVRTHVRMHAQDHAHMCTRKSHINSHNLHSPDIVDKLVIVLIFGIQRLLPR